MKNLMDTIIEVLTRAVDLIYFTILTTFVMSHGIDEYTLRRY